MNIKTFMTDHVETLTTEDTALHAARLMKQHDIGCLPVIDESSQVIGIVTDRDIVVRVFSDILPMNTKVDKFMTRSVICVTETDEIGVTISKMSEKQVRRLPVVDANKNLVGLISLTDLALNELTNERSQVVLSSVSTKTKNPNPDLDVDDFPL